MQSKKRVNVYSTLGASNHSGHKRAEHDLYCTHPEAVRALLKIENFGKRIWEPFAGLRHISCVLIEQGYDVRESDLLARGQSIEQLDFMTQEERWDGDIITNVPYKGATEFVRKCLDTVADGRKVAVWLRILYLESAERKRFFEQYPPLRVWISSRRIPCGMNGEFGTSAQGYAWYIWEKGYKGETTLKWF